MTPAAGRCCCLKKITTVANCLVRGYQNLEVEDLLAPVTHILPITMIRRERTMPVPGKVLVRAGQEVGPTDVIVESNLRPEHILLDVARGLGVSGERSDQY